MNSFEEGFMAGFLLNYKKSSSGGDIPTVDDWTYPSNWLQLPTPANNQITMLIENRGYKYGSSSYDYYDVQHTDGGLHTSYMAEIDFALTDTTSENATVIDWGDGTKPIIPTASDRKHTYEVGSGTAVGNGVEQWVVTVTFNSNLDIGTEYIRHLCADITNIRYMKMRVLAMKVGNAGYIYPSNRIHVGGLQYLELLDGELTANFQIAAYLRKIVFGDNITSLPNYAFRGNYSLGTVDLNNIESIGNYAFGDCYALRTVTAPMLNTIGEYAFSNTSLTEINFPLLTALGAYAFDNCWSLVNIVNDILLTLGSYVFNNCRELKTVNLPSVTTIERNAFANCYTLHSVILPAAESIGKYAFAGCRRLKTCEIPSSCEIPENAFSECFEYKIVEESNEN